MNIDLEDLKAKALAATPGEWVSYGVPYTRHDDAGITAGDMFIAATTVDDQYLTTRHDVDADTKFIAAANPAVVLELISRLERAGNELAVAQERCNLLLDINNESASDVERLRTDLTGAEERCKLLLDAKNYWMHMAQKYKARLDLDSQQVHAGSGSAQAYDLANKAEALRDELSGLAQPSPISPFAQKWGAIIGKMSDICKPAVIFHEGIPIGGHNDRGELFAVDAYGRYEGADAQPNLDRIKRDIDARRNASIATDAEIDEILQHLEGEPKSSDKETYQQWIKRIFSLKGGDQ